MLRRLGVLIDSRFTPHCTATMTLSRRDARVNAIHRHPLANKVKKNVEPTPGVDSPKFFHRASQSLVWL